MNVVNLAELYYILARENRKITEEKKRNLCNFGLKVISVETEDRNSSGNNNILLCKEAALLKASHSLSLADAFAAAIAKVLL